MQEQEARQWVTHKAEATPASPNTESPESERPWGLLAAWLVLNDELCKREDDCKALHWLPEMLDIDYATRQCCREVSEGLPQEGWIACAWRETCCHMKQRSRVSLC